MFIGKFFLRDEKWVEIEHYAEPVHSVIYEVIRLKDGIPLFWDAHFQRLLHSFEHIEIVLILDSVSLLKEIEKLVKINALADSNLRINVHYSKATKSRQSIELGQVSVILPKPEYYETGVDAAILEIERPIPNVKNVYTDIRKKVSDKIAEEHVWDVVLKNHFGELTEGGRTNLFFIKNSTVYTPPVRQVLPGITRSMIIKACSELNIPVYEETVKEQELETFEACFFTGTTPGIMPIKKIHSYQFNVNSPVMMQLSAFYKRMVEDDISSHRYSL